MSAPVISLILTTDTPNEGRAKINSSLESLRDNTVHLSPASAQSGLISVGEGSFTNYITLGGSPAAAGAIRLTNTNEIRWAYAGNDVYRMRNNGLTWDLSVIVGGTAYPIISAIASVVSFPYAISLSGGAIYAEMAEPATPGTGYGTVYATAGKLYFKNDDGVVHDLTSSQYSRGAGKPDASTVAEGTWRYDSTAGTLNIQINGAWVEI